MAAIIANHLEQMQRDITDFSESLEKMHSLSRLVFEELDSLTGMWEGSANQAFRDQFVKDAENMENLHTYLENYLESLQEDHTRFTKCEGGIRDLINGLEF